MLPKRIRRELGSEDRFYLILGKDGEIWGLDRENFHKQVNEILNLPLSSKTGRAMRRNFFSQAEECVLDMQGRFILPAEFVDKAALETKIVVVGAGDHFEIWNPKNLEKVLKDYEKTID